METQQRYPNPDAVDGALGSPERDAEEILGQMFVLFQRLEQVLGTAKSALPVIDIDE